jgi:ABC-type uncharacterized transport system involved in gliding motility auxiliary subunit
LFWTVLVVERRGRGGRERRLAAALTAVALLLAVGLAGRRAFDLRFDLTAGRLNSLSPDTRALLGELRSPLTLRAYVSQGRLPASADGQVRAVLDLLSDFEVAGEGRVRVEVVDPITPELQADATRHGVQRYLLTDEAGGQDTRDVFAGVVAFYEDRPAQAVPLALGRPNLELDLSLAVRKTLVPRVRVGVTGPGSQTYAEALRRLEQVQFVVGFDLDAVAEVPGDVSVLIHAAPSPLTARQAYVLDQFVARGGRLIVLAEGVAVGGSWTPRPYPAGGPLAETIAAWGLKLTPQLVAQRPWRRWALQVEGAQVLAAYPWFLGPTGAENQGSPVAAGLGRVVLPYASPVSVAAPVQGVEHVPLLSARVAWVAPGAPSLHPLKAPSLRGEGSPVHLAVGARGRLPSAWAGKPSPVWAGAGPGKEDPLAIPLAEPTGEGCVVLVGDADFLRPQWRRHGDADLLLVNLVDWCVGGGELTHVQSRTARVPLEGKDASILGLGRDAFVRALHLGLLPLGVLLFGLGRLVARRRELGAQATRTRDALAEAAQQRGSS